MQIEPLEKVKPETSLTPARWDWIIPLLVGVVLIAAAVLRFTGLNWDAGTHVHPDERFLTMVETGIAPVKSLAQYFDTAHSSLNPNNRGFGFFVYGDLPIIIVRYVAEWLGQTGYDQVYLVGRAFSATADLLVVALVFLIAEKIYNRKVALLATAFSAFAVLQIQLSHYFTVDTYSNLFTFVAVFYAVTVMTGKDRLLAWRGFSRVGGLIRPAVPFILFGVGLGMAVASKINTAPLAFLLPLAVVIRLTRDPAEERNTQYPAAIIYVGLAAITSLLVFRICQPYAFAGPGFFNVSLNPQWLSNLREVQAQSQGTVDAPFALQWTRRPVWFAWQNLTIWGLGLPLGLLAWAGVVWMAWRIISGEWRRHLLIWGWTVVYFMWFTLQLAPTMRYLILIYPTLAIIAAWAVFALWERGPKTGLRQFAGWLARLSRPAAWVLGGGVLLATAGWAVAFAQIYTRPETRVAASAWIYHNVQAPVELQVATPSGGATTQPVPTQFGAFVRDGASLVIPFQAAADGTPTELALSQAQSLDGSAQPLNAQIAPDPDFSQVVASGSLSGDAAVTSDTQAKDYRLEFDQVEPLAAGQTYYLRLETSQPGAQVVVSGALILGYTRPQGPYFQPLPEPVATLQPGHDFSTQFSALADGTVTKVSLAHVVDQLGAPGTKTLGLTLASYQDANQVAIGTVSGEFGMDKSSTAAVDARGSAYELALDRPFQLKKGETYTLTLSEEQGQGALALRGASPANETDWDLGLPLGLPDYPSAYDPRVGLYPDDLNLQVYWDDNPNLQDPSQDKLNRYATTLDQSDYIYISSNRQWGSVTRLPERYPLTTAYYRDLLGCPAEQDLLWCYRVAEPGTFQGRLGFELVKTFESYPNLGPLRVNDQFAEEAFTVYDHPKVFIFKKTAAYDPAQVRQILGAVDRSHIIHTLPKDKSLPKTLLLPPTRLAAQEAGGTWSRLFPTGDLLNQYPGIGLVAWYLAVAVLGLLAYPMVRLALPGLPDRGYPLARMAGMLLLAYLVWLAGSAGIPTTRVLISLALALIALVGGSLAYLQRDGLRREWAERRSYFIAVEVIALAFFALDLAIRLGNPDLWHPYKGGEKPMDFSYFNAVLKSTTFPPYDPWYAGGYINYYYYGFVVVGVLVKWLGIVPEVAYNLILPTLFSLLALGALSLGWNLMGGRPIESPNGKTGLQKRWWERLVEPLGWRPLQIGLAAAVGLVLLGNLGTVRMIWQGFQRLAAPGGSIDNVSILQHWIWAIQGIPRFLAGNVLPYRPGDWYWIPSRAIPGEAVDPITEFPFFTFLYADLHAHLIDLPITVLGLGWALSAVIGKGQWGEWDGRWRKLSFALSLLLGALTIGATRATNTWDFPTYLALGCIALGYAIWKNYRPERFAGLGLPEPLGRILTTGVGVGLLAALAVLLYEPFAYWYGQGYNSVELWKDNRTPFWSYLTHWGVFLFVVVSWMAWETRAWMAATPLTSLRKLRPYLPAIWVFLFGLLVAVFTLLFMKVTIAWLVLPLAAWAGVLLLRPGQSDAKRFILFLIGTALVLTLVVEVIVLKGDIGRMNTVFKFYLQAWTMLAISAAAGLGWLAAELPAWHPNWRGSWETAVMLLVFGAALFPVMGGIDKIRDRMAPDAPHTLNGMTYMLYSQYADGSSQETSSEMDLSQDYWAIRWMQQNVQGSPVIVEANTPEYRWGTRFTIYTGLPGVVGWSWHQRQQRAILPSELVTDRIGEVAAFYTTTDPQAAQQFIEKYHVEYIVVGQLEANYYPGAGLTKFGALSGILWKPVYQEGQTTIYQVMPGAAAHSQP